MGNNCCPQLRKQKEVAEKVQWDETDGDVANRPFKESSIETPSQAAKSLPLSHLSSNKIAKTMNDANATNNLNTTDDYQKIYEIRNDLNNKLHPLVHLSLRPSHSNPIHTSVSNNNNSNEKNNNVHIRGNISAGSIPFNYEIKNNNEIQIDEISDEIPYDNEDNDSSNLNINDEYDDLVDSDLTFFQDSIFTFVNWWRVK